MGLIMRMMLAIVLVLVSAGASSVLAGEPYVGFSLGQLDYEETAFGVTFEDKVLSYRLYGGYRIDDMWAIEAYYAEADDLVWIGGGPPFRVAAEYDVLEVRGLAHFGAFLAGIGYWDADLSGSLDSPLQFAPVSLTDSDSGASILVGGEWDMNSWSIRVELEYFDTEATVDALSVGVGIQFGF